MKPSIGDPVILRLHSGADVPAIVTATTDSIAEADLASGRIPKLADDDFVHLIVFTPAKPLRYERGGGTRFEVEAEHGASENTSGAYQKWNVPPNPHGADPPAPGTWR